MIKKHYNRRKRFNYTNIYLQNEKHENEEWLDENVNMYTVNEYM